MIYLVEWQMLLIEFQEYVKSPTSTVQCIPDRPKRHDGSIFLNGNLFFLFRIRKTAFFPYEKVNFEVTKKKRKFKIRAPTVKKTFIIIYFQYSVT